MTGSEVRLEEKAELGKLMVDPRRGDAEDDISSTKQRSLFVIVGSMFAEISLPKLIFAWVSLIVIPGLLLGLAPLLATAWLATVTGKILALAGFWTLIVLLAVLALGWFAGREVFRLVETNFWSLNAVAVQPFYALCREGLRQIAEATFGKRTQPDALARLRAVSAIGAGLLVCAAALLVTTLVWPATRWTGMLADLTTPTRLIVPALANAVVLLSLYLAAAALVWGFADGSMAQLMDLAAFDVAPPDARTWRVAHLSDIHIVGEKYGFRIESGRAGPRGNVRLEEGLSRLDAIHAQDPLDLVLISGDMTDAGISTEWAEFLDAMERHPALAQRTLILPGNHDLNIVDRSNPARLELPLSAGRRLRQIRTLSAMAAVHGDRVHVIERGSWETKRTLAAVLAPYRKDIETFADTGAWLLSFRLRNIWNDVFPMVLLPDSEDGLGVFILNSNAETHFSFTNALGMLSAEQMLALKAVAERYPRARWIVALHHHMMEYPMPVTAFSVRIGTALVNGSWFVRQLEPMANRMIAMHGHRHIDWIGTCGDLKIVSAPSPVMGARDDQPSHFLVHTLAAGADGSLDLLTPQRVDLAGTG